MNDKEAPKVILAGEEYAVLPVAFRDLSKIIPMLNDVLPEIKANNLSWRVLDDLATIAYHGIRRGVPELTYDSFLDLPITVDEMMTAIPVICEQAGLKIKETASGEATAA